MKLLACAVLLSSVLPAVSAAQPSESAAITFAFSNPALHPGHYSFVIHRDGAGSYHVDADGTNLALDRPITIAPPLLGALFAAAEKEHRFTSGCDAKQSHVAFTGEKTMTYAGPDGTGSCTFNYARDAALQTVANDLLAAAFTIEEGRKLEVLLAHDRLGLDAAMEELGSAAAEGNAQQLQNIAPILQTIAADPSVLQRARLRAQSLLTGVKPAR